MNLCQLEHALYKHTVAMVVNGFISVLQFRAIVINSITENSKVSVPQARARFNNIQSQYLGQHPEHRKILARPDEQRAEFAV